MIEHRHNFLRYGPIRTKARVPCRVHQLGQVDGMKSRRGIPIARRRAKLLPYMAGGGAAKRSGASQLGFSRQGHSLAFSIYRCGTVWRRAAGIAIQKKVGALGRLLRIRTAN